jgi:hypothetical protein
MPDQDEFKVEAYGTVTPPPEPDDEPLEGDEEDEED